MLKKININMINDNSFIKYIKDFDITNINEIEGRIDYYKCFNKLEHL